MMNKTMQLERCLGLMQRVQCHISKNCWHVSDRRSEIIVIVSELWSQNCIKQIYFSDLYQLIKRYLVQHLSSSTPSPRWTQLLCDWSRHYPLPRPYPQICYRMMWCLSSGALPTNDPNPDVVHVPI